jgi:hypothetical protein
MRVPVRSHQYKITFGIAVLLGTIFTDKCLSFFENTCARN